LQPERLAPVGIPNGGQIVFPASSRKYRQDAEPLRNAADFGTVILSLAALFPIGDSRRRPSENANAASRAKLFFLS